MVKNPSWQEADQLAINSAAKKLNSNCGTWTRDLRIKMPAPLLLGHGLLHLYTKQVMLSLCYFPLHQ